MLQPNSSSRNRYPFSVSAVGDAAGFTVDDATAVGSWV